MKPYSFFVSGLVSNNFDICKLDYFYVITDEMAECYVVMSKTLALKPEMYFCSSFVLDSRVGILMNARVINNCV
jgi:hypothetical protein